MQGDSQRPVGARQLATFLQVPAAIELIVGVQAETAVEVSEQRLAAACYGLDSGAGERVFEALERRLAEVDVFQYLTVQHTGQAIGSPADFGALRHSDFSAP